MNTNVISNNSNLLSKYWRKKILNREKVLELDYKKENLLFFVISSKKLDYFNRLTNNNLIAQFTVISAIYSLLLKRLIYGFDGYIVSNNFSDN